jgi:hypothetical protein
MGGFGKLAHCHPAMLTVFLQALSDVWIDGALAIHWDHAPNAKNGRRTRRGGCLKRVYVLLTKWQAGRFQRTSFHSDQ